MDMEGQTEILCEFSLAERVAPSSLTVQGPAMQLRAPRQGGSLEQNENAQLSKGKIYNSL